MARAWKLAWVSVAVGGVFGAADVEAQAPANAPIEAVSAVDAGQSRAARVHNALRTGMECYRSGDYERAATNFQQAKAGQDDLTADERQSLSQWLQLNETALRTRSEASAQVRQVEEALKLGRTQDAINGLKTVTRNQQFLAAADKQRLQQLTEQLLPNRTGTIQPVSNMAALAQARSKLTQARLMMSRGNFDAAQVLAQEADRLGATYAMGEDTPKKVLDDLSEARASAALPNDAKGLLVAARAALARGNLNEADMLARRAEHARSVLAPLKFWDDSPAKVIKDVQTARVRQLAQHNAAKAKEQPSTTFNAMKPYVNQDTVTTTAGDNNTEAARKLLRDARRALRAGDAVQARQLCEKARALKPELNWYEDTPDKILGEIRQVEGPRDPSQSKSSFAADTSSADPRTLLKQGRDLFNAGKLEEADRLAQQANTSKAHWGLFEDSPEKLSSEIRKARTKHEQEESVLLMAEARKLYEKGDLSEAERLAHAAERKHGPYSYWDLGDRPSKLLAEVEAAKSKTHPASMPPAPGTVAIQDIPPVQNPPMVSERTTDAAERMVSHTTSTPLVPPAATVTGDGKKAQAQVLLTQARQLQKDGSLVEARQRALEAQRVGANFGPEEDRPEQCLLAVNALCQRHIENHLQQASELLAAAELDPARYQRAEAELTQAKQLAATFGFDAQMIDAQLTVVRQARNKNVSTVPGMSKSQISQAAHQESMLTGSESPQQRGHNLLNQARMELRAGQMVSARKLAVEAFDPRYGVQEEAAQVMRSLDAEEFNQKLLAADRNFNVAMLAFNRREFTQASLLLRSIDPHHLSPEKQARLKEVMLVPEMQPDRVAQAVHETPASPGTRRYMAQASDLPRQPATSPEGDFAKQVVAMQEVKFQKLRNDGMESQKDAMRLFQAGDTDRALEILQDYNNGLANAGLDADRAAMLRRPIDSRLAQLKTLKHQRDFEKQQANQHDSAEKRVRQRIITEQEKKEKVAELMKQHNALFKEGKYQEALVFAYRARDLDPDNTVADAAIFMTQNMIKSTGAKKDKQGKEDFVLNALNGTDKEGPALEMDNPVGFDAKTSLANRDRKPIDFKLNIIKSEKTQQIYRRLDQPVSSLDFKDMPLKQILDDLQGMTGINIVIDEPALQDAGITLDKQITQRLDGISLKFVLEALLHQAHLTFHVQNEVLNITTEDHAHGKLETKIYPVLDLVMPVPNSDASAASNALNTAMSGESNLKLGGTSPYQGLNGLGGGKDVSMSQFGGASGGAGNFTTPTVTKENPRGTIENTLIKLITNTIQPQTWESMGGHGRIEFYPLGQALVISQTPDIQEQVAELLQALRRLQDQEVAIEVRFITIAESFFERIGVDFSVNIRTDNSKYEPQIVSQQFRPFGFINHFTPKAFISGLTPGGSLTQDLNIPIKPSSFQMAIPPFGEYPNIPGGNGGVSLGLAFLSDIEVYMFMEAAQGDQRTNVMEAPKITLTNGQTSTITVADQQFFVTQVQVLQAGGQIVFVPTNTLFPTGGVALALNAVISADRRFVRLSITPTLSSLASANVPLFPITTFITPIFEGGAVGQPVPFTQFIQQPTFNTITVNTTVNVPDGGTVLMGGLKRLNEGRNEFGPPILSKIPYLNRLFRNVGYGREAESLMIMVTPRIIINEEEELKAVPGIGATTGGPGQ